MAISVIIVALSCIIGDVTNNLACVAAACIRLSVSPATPPPPSAPLHRDSTQEQTGQSECSQCNTPVTQSIITTHGISLPFSFSFQEANREYAEFFKGLARAVGGSVAVEACVPRPPSPPSPSSLRRLCVQTLAATADTSAKRARRRRCLRAR
jgi:hypothetical protein